MSSMFCQTTADAFANLTKQQRIEEAVKAYAEDDRLTARKTEKIMHTTITQHLKNIIKSRKAVYES